MARKNMLTIFHMMDDKGVFDVNPANVQARDAEGASIYKKADFPKMLYSPTGDYIITNPGEEVETAGGRIILLNERKELIYKIVNSSAEEKALLAEGWFDHPAKSIAAGGKAMPDMGAQAVLENKDAEIEALKAQIAAMQGKYPGTPPKSNGPGKGPTPASASPPPE